MKKVPIEKIKILKVFNKNPYKEGSNRWNAWLDISYFSETKKDLNKIITIKEIQECHGLGEEHYELLMRDALKTLIKDKFIKTP